MEEAAYAMGLLHTRSLLLALCQSFTGLGRILEDIRGSGPHTLLTIPHPCCSG
jgi:hypothetical protein